MVWFRVDDNLAFHKRAVEVGNAAISVWVRASAWAAANNTGGYIPASTANELGAPKTLCDRLVKAGLFEEKDGGYQFHDWDYQGLSKADKAAADSSARTSRRGRHTGNNPGRRLTAVPSIDPTKGTNQ
jgi:hypothetical protein